MSSVSKFHNVVRLLQPSFSSSVLAMAVSLGVVLTLLSPPIYKGSEFAVYFDALVNRPSSFRTDYQAVSAAINNSIFAADVAVFAVWMVIGLLAYAIALSVFKLILSLVRFVRDVEYFRADRERLALEALTHLGMRLLAVVGLYGFYMLLMPHVVSYVFIFAHTALTGSWLRGSLYTALMMLIVGLCVHVAVVLLRLTLLRVRVFFDRYAASDT